MFLFGCIFIYCFSLWVFFAQADNSDIVTFSKAGDAMLQNLPLFVRNGKLLANGIFDGIDNLVTNGSNTIHTPTLMINGYNSPPLAA
jgi:hypothetical protein